MPSSFGKAVAVGGAGPQTGSSAQSKHSPKAEVPSTGVIGERENSKMVLDSSNITK